MSTQGSSLGVQNHVDASKEKALLFSMGKFATSLLAIVALLALFLTLAGYGVALAVEMEFGIPHATIFKSSFDLLTLSVWFIAWISSNLSNIFNDLFLSWKFLLWVLAIGFLATTVFLLKNFSSTFCKWLAKITFIKNLVAKKTLSCPQKIFIEASLLGIFSMVFGSLIAPLILVFAIVVLACTSIISTTSMEAGQKHIQKYVLSPENCAATASRSERLDPAIKPRHGATCVKVVDDGKTIAIGRVVFSTTDLIVLYDPVTGKVTRESTNGRTIEVVSQI